MHKGDWKQHTNLGQEYLIINFIYYYLYSVWSGMNDYLYSILISDIVTKQSLGFDISEERLPDDMMKKLRKRTTPLKY